jgi:hypothetical protein
MIYKLHQKDWVMHQMQKMYRNKPTELFPLSHEMG